MISCLAKPPITLCDIYFAPLSGAADVASEEYHPACFVSDKIDTEAGYGVCMVEEIVQHTEYNGWYSNVLSQLYAEIKVG